MTTNIEARLEALEQKLAPSDPEERQVFIVVGVRPDRTIAPIVAYNDWTHVAPRAGRTTGGVSDSC